MSICVIPARGGSKRIPGKNVRDFCGKPMIQWSIEAARTAGCFDRIIVSTDSAAIAEVAIAVGAETPFSRPAELSDDHAITSQVMLHALEFLDARDELPATLCCLYATAPFVQVDDLRAGFAAMQHAQLAMPVTRFPFPIQRAVKILPNERLAMFSPEHYCTRSQDLEEAWHDAGQFYWGTASAWRNQLPLFGTDTVPVRLPRWRVQDIDDEEDWIQAEALFRALGFDHRSGT